MIVRRISIASFPVLAALGDFLDDVTIPHPPYDEKGDWAQDIECGPPAIDRPRPWSYRRHFMADVRARPAAMLPEGVSVSAVNYYPAGGAGLGWHTDSANRGWRVYIARPLGGARGEFIVRDRVYFDEEGIALAFETGPESWHAVRAQGPRLSLGLRVLGGRGREVGL